MGGCVCVYGSGMLICFVSALGSHEMGRHKLPIIIIILLLLLPLISAVMKVCEIVVLCKLDSLVKDYIDPLQLPTEKQKY